MVKYWWWLVKKFEKHVSNWTYCFLSLGGRLILLNSMLSGIPVYWFSLVKISSSILKEIKNIMINFLWVGVETSTISHLVRWEVISRPYCCGGWNVKNLEWFNVLSG